ncbi:MAG: hypothetical protein ABI234_11320 [Ktedonobacteraceae bacterium]
MTATASNWQVLSLFTLTGFFLGMLGALYLAYDFFNRQPKILHRCVFVFSYGFLFTSVLVASCLFFIAHQRFATGYPLMLIWRLIATFGFVGFFMQFLTLSPFPQTYPPIVDWLKLVYWVVLTSIGLVWLGTILLPQGSSLIEAVIFALPGILIMGLLNGFSPVIQWWIFHLPEKRVAAIGTLLIFCAFALAVVSPLLSLLGIPLR